MRQAKPDARNAMEDAPQEVIDTAIARYREQLAQEVDVGRAVLDEIEDHLRILIDELRASGLPTAKAIHEAARRLGDPREVAREHARVRTAFGAKLPLWRALAAIALLMPQLMDNLSSPSAIDTACGVLGLALCGALTWRSAWARAALFGAMAWSSIWAVASLALSGRQPEAWMVALQLVTLALVAPYRRADLTTPGWGIALLYPMYTTAAWLLYVDVTGTGHGPVPSMWFAAIGTLVTGAGLVLRARWASITAAVSTFVVVCWFFEMLDFYLVVPRGGMHLTAIACAIAAGIAVTGLAARCARSTVGDLENVLA